MKIIIQNNSEQPIYQQIVSQLEQSILNGELVEGDSLPSIRELARHLKVSVITTSRAYAELENLGYINTVPGKGCFVQSINNLHVLEQLQLSMEQHLSEAIKIAGILSIQQDELFNLIKQLMEGDYEQ